ncbi:hypothetical protein IG631_18478 [Alternaria alternata]|nr:hypothetical protein IG631_18478 [Alternaria alternata]
MRGSDGQRKRGLVVPRRAEATIRSCGRCGWAGLGFWSLLREVRQQGRLETEMCR